MAGIERSTILRWQQDETPFARMVRNRIATARGRREMVWLGLVQDSARPGTIAGRNGQPVNVLGDWRAAAWLLERTNPEYAPIGKTEISGRGGAPIQIEHDVRAQLETRNLGQLQVVFGLLENAGAVPLLTGNGNGNGHEPEG